MSIADVLAGKARWHVEQADCIAWLKAMPESSVDLVFGSPPYVAQRTYSIGFDLKGQQWVDWMVEVVKASLRVCRGLVAFVVEGATQDRAYDCTPILLMADLHRAGITVRKPPIYRRIGIPGSGGARQDHGDEGGGADWLRNDYEWIVCCTRGGKLPWADGTACGHAPVYPPGGKMSNRLQNGERVDAREKTRYDKRFRDRGKTSSKNELQGYKPPEKANPGNVINPALSLAEFTDILMDYEQETNSTSDQILRDLRQAIASGGLREWFYGRCLQVRAAAFLRLGLYGGQFPQETAAEDMPSVRHGDAPDNLSQRQPGISVGVRQEDLLQSQVPGCGGSTTERSETWRAATSRPEDSSADDTAGDLREVRKYGATSRSSSRRGCDEQSSGESSSSVHDVSPDRSQESRMQRSRVREVLLRSGILLDALPTVQEVWRSVGEMFGKRQAAEGSNLISCKVGGGQMGSRLCHENVAPFPEDLAKFFILSFCQPNGIVADIFSGSGTTAAVAVRYGRRFVGCDLRDSQVQLTRRRVSGETPDMFAMQGIEP